MHDDALFASDNDFGIPALDAGLQAEWVEAPCRAWGSCSRTRPHLGTWHFYVDDYRWAAIWERPWQVTDTTPTASVEPNYSLSDDTPAALALPLIYRKRWLARYWQAHGVRVLVDLFVPAVHAGINLLGVPRGWRSYATRGSDRDPAGLERDWQVACDRAGTRRIAFAVFAGGRKTAAWCRDRGAFHVPYAGTRNVHSAAIAVQSECRDTRTSARREFS